MVLLIFPGIIGLFVCAILLIIKAITKKPKKKTVIAFWICVAMCVVAIGSVGDDTSDDPTPTTPTTVQAPTTAPTAEPTVEPTVEPTEPATEATEEPATEQATMSASDAADLVVTMVKLSLVDNFSYYTVEGDETGITLCVAQEGLVEELTLAQLSGYDENYEDWVSVKDSLAGLCDSIYDSAVSFGMKNPVITVSVLNDQNHDNVILMIMNGVVVYDVMAK